MTNFLISLAIILLPSMPFLSQTITWTGSTDSDWHKSCNWDLGIVPTCSHDVQIPDLANDPDITAIAHCNTITIQGSAVTDLLSGSGGLLDVGQGGSCSGVPTDNGGCTVIALSSASYNCASQESKWPSGPDPHSVTLNINSSGGITRVRSAGGCPGGSWASGSFNAADYEVRFSSVVLSGAGSITGTANVWLNLSSNRSIGVTRSGNSNGVTSVTGTVQIRDVATSTVITSASFNLSAETQS